MVVWVSDSAEGGDDGEQQVWQAVVSMRDGTKTDASDEQWWKLRFDGHTKVCPYPQSRVLRSENAARLDMLSVVG